MAAAILLVEPDPQTRVLAAFMLERLGYLVSPTRSGAEAVAVSEGRAFDLLLTEAVMSRMNGHDLAGKLCAAQPGLRALFLADAEYERIARKEAGKRGIRFLRRPFTMATLAAAVADALGERALFAGTA